MALSHYHHLVATDQTAGVFLSDWVIKLLEISKRIYILIEYLNFVFCLVFLILLPQYFVAFFFTLSFVTQEPSASHTYAGLAF